VGDLDQSLFFSLYGGDAHAPAVLFAMVALTMLGSGWSTLPFLPLLAARRTRAAAAFLLSTFLVTAGLVQLVKLAGGRARPCVALAGVHALFGAPTDASFPSGHAAGAFAFAGFVSAVTLARRRSVRLAFAGAACLVAAGIAVSRVYLGCHYPGDVIGGALLGGVVGFAGGRLSKAEL
jgi:undecaprenyl-diphosphatase